jgi:hypothetical protein
MFLNVQLFTSYFDDNYKNNRYRRGEFLNLPNPSGRTRPWGLLSLLTEMSIRKIIMFLGSRVRRVRKADNITVIYEPIV